MSRSAACAARSSCTTPRSATARSRPGLSYSIEDRLRILHKLDQLGVPFIEGGWPGANPRDTEFFRLATKETLQHADADVVRDDAEGGRGAEDERRPPRPAGRGHRGRVHRRQGVGPPRHRGAPHRPRRGRGDGARLGRVPARAGPPGVLRRRALLRRLPEQPGVRAPGARGRAEEAGAERLVLCDTNGGMLPDEVARDRRPRSRDAGQTRRSGIHVHNDAGCAVANSLIAVEHGAFQVQGVVNGYGERTGNADLIPIAANLVLKMGADCLPDGSPRTAHRGRALRGRGGEHRPGLAPAVRGPVRVHAQGRAARERRRPPARTRTSTSRPTRSATGAASSRATWAARRRSG